MDRSGKEYRIDMKELLLGNAAIARGAYEAGVRVISAYPGTPSTEISEEAAKYEEIYAEWAPNEKVALETAIGSAIAGARSMAVMKHVGVNVAADPLFTASYTGVNAGLVIVAADDPGMHSSQNEQDSKFYARSSFIPLLEPGDSEEARIYVKKAFEISEKFDVPVMLRTTTRIAHSRGFVTLQPRDEVALRDYQKDIPKYVMMPALAQKKHVIVEERNKRVAEYSDTSDLNTEEILDRSLGIVCSGAVYRYVKEVLPKASVFKIGMVYPLPLNKIAAFAKKVKRLVVIEELEPFFEDAMKAAGIACEGKNLFSHVGEILASDIRKALCDGKAASSPEKNLPARPPVLCAGCPHRGVFYVLNQLKKTVTGDIGCYTLGATSPLCAVDTVVCMGASVSMNHGMEKARGRDFSKNTIAVIGDSTFIHSGITGLIHAVYNQSNITVMILDNSTTGMTGHQDHPATGKTLKGNDTYALDLEALCKSVGVASVVTVDSFDLDGLEKAVKAESARDGVSVIIAKRPCALKVKLSLPPAHVEHCKNCKMCLKLACPAIASGKDGVQIDESLCVGCGLCAKVCKFSAIQMGKSKK